MWDKMEIIKILTLQISKSALFICLRLLKNGNLKCCGRPFPKHPYQYAILGMVNQAMKLLLCDFVWKRIILK